MLTYLDLVALLLSPLLDLAVDLLRVLFAGLEDLLVLVEGTLRLALKERRRWRRLRRILVGQNAYRKGD